MINQWLAIFFYFATEPRNSRPKINNHSLHSNHENNEDLIKEEAHRYINKDSIFELKISKKTPRKEVLELLQHYEELYDSSKFYSDEYASSKLNIVKDDLIEELRELSKKVELKLENAKYYKKDGNYSIKVRKGLSFEVTPESANIIIDGKRLQ